MIKLLAIDMDGTCLDSHSRVTERTLTVLRKAADAGIILVPTTGRNLKCLPHQLWEAQWEQRLFRYVITSNGARVIDLRKREPIFKAEISRETALDFLAEIVDCSGVGIASHMRNEYLVQGRWLGLLGRLVYGEDAKGVLLVRDMERFVERNHENVEELQFYFLKSKAEPQVRQILKGYPQLAAAYDKNYVEVFSREATKGTALAAISAALGIPAQEIACIGDGENDMTMFRQSGLCIAMGNAVPELKDAADYVAASNKEDGAAEAIEKILRS